MKRNFKFIIYDRLGLLICILPALLVVCLFWQTPFIATIHLVMKVVILTSIFLFVYFTTEVGFKSLHSFSFKIDKRFYLRNLAYIMFGAFESYYVMRRKIQRIVFFIFLVFPLGLFLMYGPYIGFTFGDALKYTVLIYAAKCFFAGYGMTMSTLLCKGMFPGEFGRVSLYTNYAREYGFPCYAILGCIYCAPKMKIVE